MVVAVAKGPGEADLALGPGRDPGADPGLDQGHPGEIEMLEARVPVEARTNLGLSHRVAVATGTATTAATTTAAGRMTTRRMILLRTPIKVRILVSPLPLPLWKLGTHHSLLLLLCCFSPLWVLWLVGFLHWISCH